ncbi:MAG TPA: c-type cytochrome domain-containing protein [Flavipsychrobacter sp.]|nr:c-type cytochrome domain-containing protein [Flavipsychrobacter sp.]
MKKHVSILIISVFTACNFLSCKHEVPQPAANNPANPNDTTGNGNAVDTALCFERDILPIFISNCAKSGCHDAATREEGYEFTSYATITSKKFKPGDLNDTELWEKINEDDADDIMPPLPNASLTTEQKMLIRNWILRGAPNTANCATNCDSSKYKFATDIQPMINTYCKGCHNNITPSGGYSYDSYAGILVPIQNGRFLGAIRHQTGFAAMPRGGNKLSDCQIKKIENWIANGTPND